MSTEFVLARPAPLLYEEALVAIPDGVRVGCRSDALRPDQLRVPEGVRITWRSDSGTPLRPDRPRVYIEAIEHAELRDRCENVVYVRKATEGTARQRTPTKVVVGEAIFEQWGGGGWIEHVDAAFRQQYGAGLVDLVTGLDATDAYFGLCKRCRPAGSDR